jgi:hypothetical protein
MKAVTGVFGSGHEAEQAAKALHRSGFPQDKVITLIPGEYRAKDSAIPVDSAEQPGVGKAIGALVGAAAGLSGGVLVAAIPGVGPVTALGYLGASILGLAGAGVGAAAGGAVENATTEGLPEDEFFVYEDALRHGRSVVIALAEDDAGADSARALMKQQDAESIDSARDQWWIGLRSAEQEHYRYSGRNFDQDEMFFRMGFEAALHARTRCKEYDQILSEMTANLEELQQLYPGVDIEKPYTHGFERGREYYQRLCNEKKVA